MTEVKKEKYDPVATRLKLLAPTCPKNECMTFWKGKKGEKDCKSDHIRFKSKQSTIKHYIERTDHNMMELLKPILDQKKKLVCFHGYAGLGKTYIVRYILHYINERKFFIGGNIYLDLKQINKIEWLYKKLFKVVLQFFEIKSDRHR